MYPPLEHLIHQGRHYIRKPSKDIHETYTQHLISTHLRNIKLQSIYNQTHSDSVTYNNQ